jgi:hypothetical protein
MSWGRIDDKLHDSPKFAKVHDPRSTRSRSGCTASRGRSAPAQGRRRASCRPTSRFGTATAFAIEKLVAAGLWTAIDDGFEHPRLRRVFGAI